MKRSEIQGAVLRAKGLLEVHQVSLPMFGYWTLDEWRKNAGRLDTIVQTMRGWDVTDFGSGDFRKVGAVLFTIRNGVLGTDIGCPYAEKLIIIADGQALPLHFHYKKTEDIINRGGGLLAIQVYNSLPDGKIDEKNDVEVHTDGMRNVVKAGAFVEITPGNSMTIRPYMYHQFVARAGCGDLIVGEVSAVNDDRVDNRFAVERSRFSSIEEDQPITVPLCNEYGKLLIG